PPVPARPSAGSPQRATSVATPIGTLMRKIQRQLASTSRPPTGGPDDPATAATPAQMPTTVACCRLGNDGYSRPRDVGTIIAAPTACTARAATRKASDGAG